MTHIQGLLKSIKMLPFLSLLLFLSLLSCALQSHHWEWSWATQRWYSLLYPPNWWHLVILKGSSRSPVTHPFLVVSLVFCMNLWSHSLQSGYFMSVVGLSDLLSLRRYRGIQTVSSVSCFYSLKCLEGSIHHIPPKDVMVNKWWGTLLFWNAVQVNPCSHLTGWPVCGFLSLWISTELWTNKECAEEDGCGWIFTFQVWLKVCLQVCW